MKKTLAVLLTAAFALGSHPARAQDASGTMADMPSVQKLNEFTRALAAKNQALEKSKAALLAAGFALKTECNNTVYYRMAGDGCSDRSTYGAFSGWEHGNPKRCMEMTVAIGMGEIWVSMLGQVDGSAVAGFA